MSSVRNSKEVSQEEVQPWYRLGGVEHICELRKNAQVLYAILVTTIRMIYSTKDGRTFGCPDVVWSKNNQKTEIWIDTELRYEDQRIDFTPAIYVSIDGIQYESLPSLDREARIVMSHDGEQHYERTAHGTATILHVSDTAGSACSLADNTENFLSMLQDKICEEYCFDCFNVVGRIPRQKKETQQANGKEKYFSAVKLDFEFTDAWKVKVESPILKAVNMIYELKSNKSTVDVLGTSTKLHDETMLFDHGDISTDTNTPKDI